MWVGSDIRLLIDVMYALFSGMNELHQRLAFRVSSNKRILENLNEGILRQMFVSHLESISMGTKEYEQISIIEQL